MFKRSILLTVLLMFIFGTSLCWAEDNSAKANTNDIYKQATEVANLYNDCIYLYQSSGLSYQQFDEMYTKATIAKNRFMSKNKTNISPDIIQAFEITDSAFADTRNMWHDYIEYKYLSKTAEIEALREKYPKLKSVKREGIFGDYDAGEMAKILATYCVEYNNKLNDLISKEGN